MDELDHRLKTMEKAAPPTQLRGRIRSQFRRRVQRRKRIQNLAGLAATVGGFFFLLPGIQEMVQMLNKANLNQDVIENSLRWLITGSIELSTLQNLDTLQNNLIATFTLTTWAGIIILAVGAGISLNAWLPKNLSEI